MFKLLKINNSTSNTPEIEMLKKLSSDKPKAGDAVRLHLGRISNCESTQRPTHIILRDYKDSETTIPAYRITSDMVFEADYYGEEELIVGSDVPLGSRGSGAMSGLADPTEDGPATVISANGNKAIVYFK